MALENLLAKFDLRDNGAKVYLTSLQLGPATMTELAKASGTKRSTTYLIIEDLLLRGFLTQIKRGKRKIYAPEPPKRLIQLLQYRLKEAEYLLPELEALYREPKAKPSIKIFEGKQGVIQIYNELYAYLNKKQEVLFLTSIGALNKYLPESLEDFIKQTSAKKGYHVRELIVADTAGKIYAKKNKSRLGEYHFIRLLNPQFHLDNTDNFIFGNKLAIFSLKQNIFVIVIENKDIADTYRALFNSAWEISTNI